MPGSFPDVPRWVEARAALLGDDARTFGEGVVARDDYVIWVAATASDEEILDAVAAVDAAVMAGAELGDRLADLLPGWTRDRDIVHSLVHRARLPEPGDDVMFLDPAAIAGLAVDDDLRDELADGSASSAIAAMFEGAGPVAFSYACAQTETFWDISIDTLATHRRRGYGGRCVARMIEHMAPREPVWQAAESNPASWRLAAKLGFEPVDELVSFERPDD